MIKIFNKLYTKNADSFYALLREKLKEEEKTFIVTANPEIFMISQKCEDVRELLLDENTTIVADGIGVIKGAKKVGIEVDGRICGVDISAKLFEFGSEMNKSVFLLGAKQEVLDALGKVLEEKYPGLEVAGSVNGYVPDKDAVFEEIKAKKPDIILVALGVPAQERLIYKHLDGFDKGIFVGIGGSFDVLSGTKERAPKFFINHNLEWLYRLLKEPSRIKRFYNNNIKFLFSVKKK